MSSLSFAHLSSTRPRTQPARAIVLHTTGGVRPPEGVFETLKARRLSCHYIVGADGRVLQTAPHDLVCKHAGKVNNWTIGVEICSPLLATTIIAEIERKRGVYRRVYRDRVRGRRTLELLALTDAQMTASILLVEQLCDQLSIPRLVPTDEHGMLLRREMTTGELATFAGAMGHYHCHPSKLDPATDLLDALRLKWAAQEAA